MGKGVEHDGEVGLAGELAVGEIASVDHRALFWLTDGWGPLTCGSPLLASSVRVFVIYFLDFCTNYRKSYLELEMSNFSESNFVGFLMKCSIL